MTSAPPIPGPAACCLFVDIDGTLLDFAPSPDQVRVDEPLRELLRGLDRHCDGAVALVSGRTIVDIDDLFEPLYLAAAGIHGCERRDALGHWRRGSVDSAALEDLRERLGAELRSLDGVWVEDKGCALAIHYRLVPQLEPAVRAAVARLAPLPATLQALDGDCVIEIKPRAHNTATAIEAFMQEPPFAGRIPVFIGDERTDRDGFDAVRRMNGLAITVGARPAIGTDARSAPGAGERTTAEWQLPDPTAVRRWLEGLLQKA